MRSDLVWHAAQEDTGEGAELAFGAWNCAMDGTDDAWAARQHSSSWRVAASDVCILGWLGKGSGDMDVKLSGKVAAGRRQVEAGQRRSLQRVRCRALSCNLTAKSKATAVLPQQSHDSTFHSCLNPTLTKSLEVMSCLRQRLVARPAYAGARKDTKGYVRTVRNSCPLD